MLKAWLRWLQDYLSQKKQTADQDTSSHECSALPEVWGKILSSIFSPDYINCQWQYIKTRIMLNIKNGNVNSELKKQKSWCPTWAQQMFSHQDDTEHSWASCEGIYQLRVIKVHKGFLESWEFSQSVRWSPCWACFPKNLLDSWNKKGQFFTSGSIVLTCSVRRFNHAAYFSKSKIPYYASTLTSPSACVSWYIWL